ncbi:inner membrane protein [Andreprevotia lacus DSM 23236]|jgi:inner membrane protein|uniref:Inner membrane protein n=1 Tax=Andreprevotia lacus DSM 23236 TaxID=1121001 RepID=A0A1W1X0K6_9NEIS|nr:metal-dependent hydrolase [Andreprevotia lacus]SMC16911.1 inner membrane protein [Andreprevotia lacus DSM 23236]
MTTVFTHALVGATLIRCLPARWRSPRLYDLAIVGAMAPDLDVLSFRLGIAYADDFGHRGAMHSLLAALLLGLLLALLHAGLRGRAPFRVAWAALFAAVASHGPLDALTNGGEGVAFFWPFSSERFFFPVTPIAVSPIGAHFFSSRGAHTLMSEALWVALPCLLLWLGLHLRDKTKE